MKKLVIDRATWLRGGLMTTGKESMLRDPQGCKCCLGFFAEQHCGFGPEMALYSEPADLQNETIQIGSSGAFPPELVRTCDPEEHDGRFMDTPLCCQLMGVNDQANSESVHRKYRDFYETTSDGAFEKAREGTIKELFAKIDVEVEFIGEGFPS